MEWRLTLPDLPSGSVAGMTAVEALGTAMGGATRVRKAPEPGALGLDWGRGSSVARELPSSEALEGGTAIAGKGLQVDKDKLA